MPPLIPPDKVNVLELPDVILRFKNSYPTSLTSITLSATASLLSIVKVIGESSSLPEQANRMNENSNKPNFLIMSYFLKSALLYFFPNYVKYFNKFKKHK